MSPQNKHQPRSPESSTIGLGRRDFLKLGGAAAGALILYRIGNTVADFFGGEEGQPLAEITEIDPPVAHVELEAEALKDRAEQLEKYNVESLANYLLKRAEFDEDTPRVRESMEWARKFGVLPLVNPEIAAKDTRDFAQLSPFVPVQAPLLITLALLTDAGLKPRITSLATSSEHQPGSHHYQGRGVDLSLSDKTSAMVAALELLHREEIIGVDNLVLEGNHLHVSTVEVETKEPGPAIELFSSGSAAYDAAEELGITAASYFNMTREQGDALSQQGGFGSEEARELLKPLFPPAVTQFEDAIHAATAAVLNSTGTYISPNFVASIMTIETSGRDDLTSGEDAHGVIQVVPRHHRESIDQLAGHDFGGDDVARGAYLRNNPTVSIEVGAEFLAELVEKARRDNPDLPENHPAIYARAAAGYNGGPRNTRRAFGSWAKESKIYANLVSAFYVDVAIAGKLKAGGHDDDAIQNALISDSMHARTAAMRSMGVTAASTPYELLSESYRRFEGLRPGVGEGLTITNAVDRATFHLARAGYEGFANDAQIVPKNLPPALTMALAHGGIHLFNGSEMNVTWARQLSED